MTDFGGELLLSSLHRHMKATCHSPGVPGPWVLDLGGYSAESGPADVPERDGCPLLVGLGGAPLASEARGAGGHSCPRCRSCFEAHRRL